MSNLDGRGALSGLSGASGRIRASRSGAEASKGKDRSDSDGESFFLSDNPIANPKGVEAATKKRHTVIGGPMGRQGGFFGGGGGGRGSGELKLAKKAKGVGNGKVDPVPTAGEGDRGGEDTFRGRSSSVGRRTEWIEAKDDISGETYYYNSKTMETAWDPPEGHANRRRNSSIV